MTVYASISLQSLDSFAARLHDQIFDLDLLAAVLRTLLESCGSVRSDAGGEFLEPQCQQISATELTSWCLEGLFICCEGPAAILRTLVLRHTAAGLIASAESRARICTETPRLLVAAKFGSCAKELAHTVAELLQNDKDAAVWLRTLRPEGVGAYAIAAEAVLTKYPQGEAMEEAWDAASIFMTECDASDRHACAKHLLPSLVSLSGKLDAATMLSSFVGTLLDGSNQAKTSEALSIAVSFHEVLLDYWRFTSLAGDHDELGLTLIVAGLRFAQQEGTSGRKCARFLLEQTLTRALASSDSDVWLRENSVKVSDLNIAWQSLWALFDALEASSSHMLTQSWDDWFTRLGSFIECVSILVGNSATQRCPPALLPLGVLEAVLSRALGHANDTVHKFVLCRLMNTFEGVVRLSDSFILEKILPCLSHRIDFLYPKRDVDERFGHQVSRFFSSFLTCDSAGAGERVQSLVSALLESRVLHHTALRFVLNALIDAKVADALAVADALDTTDRFFSSCLPLMPMSTRPSLASKFVDAVRSFVRPATDTSLAVALMASVAASIPGSLLSDVRRSLGDLARFVLGVSAEELMVTLFGGLVASEHEESDLIIEHGIRASPMEVVKLTLGIVRVCWTLEVSPDSVSCLWPLLVGATRKLPIELKSSRRIVVATLFGAAYASVMLPFGMQHLQEVPQMRLKLLACVEAYFRTVLSDLSGTSVDEATDTSVVQMQNSINAEVPWVWLYAFALERFWEPDLPHGDSVYVLAQTVLSRSSTAISEADILSRVSATVMLSALAPRVRCARRRAELFGLLLQTGIQRPLGVSDMRNDVCHSPGIGVWRRSRMEEYHDLHRFGNEGLGRILEWRDVIEVFFIAKWRALASLSLGDDIGAELTSSSCAVTKASTQGLWTALALVGPSQGFAAVLLSEFETVQAPCIGYMAIVLRRLVYPSVFVEHVSEEIQRSVLQSVCSGLTSAIGQGFGDKASYLSNECLVELAGALCDPRLCEAESRLYAFDRDKPLSTAVRSLLSLGEHCVGVSRGLVVPLIGALLRVPASSNPTLPWIVETFVSLLMHSEAMLMDGALTHAPKAASGALDAEGPCTMASLLSACPAASKLCAKFGRTPGLARVLAMAALDAQRNRRTLASPLVVAVVRHLFNKMREILNQVLRLASGKQPLPTQSHHKLQLRGWQALLVLAPLDDRETMAWMLPELWFHLRAPHVPDVRDYQEMLACVLCVALEEFAVESFLVPALLQFDNAIQVSSSLLLIMCYLCKRWAERIKSGSNLPEHVTKVVSAAAPYLCHNAAHVRGAAAWGLSELLGALGDDGIKEIFGCEAAFLSEIHRFLLANSKTKGMRNRLQPLFVAFDPGARTRLECLTELSYVLPPLPGDSEGRTKSQFFHSFSDADFHPTETFMESLVREVTHEMDDRFEKEDPTTYPSCSDAWRARFQAAVHSMHPTQRVEGFDTRELRTGISSERCVSTQVGTQRKIDSQSLRQVKRAREPLVVVATLVDLPANLAGLSRTSEIFNCEALWVANLRITKEPAFMNVSVNAERWLPIKEVARDSLRKSLLALRERGYALIGVEQTHDSVMLDEWKFTRKTALILGNEKEGIDAELYHLFDACLEIPQSGQLRSLNAHVSGCLAIWEYVSQLRKS